MTAVSPQSQSARPLDALFRPFDWATTAAGPVASWPQSLLRVVELLQSVQTGMVLFWGPDYLAFYNEAFKPTMGSQHPAALGQPAALHWTELWPELEPLLPGVRTSGASFSAQDRPFQINRSGYPEQVNFDISCSAVRGDGGQIDGVLCIVRETTEKVRASQALANSEAALRKEQAFARLLLDSSSEGFCAVDCDGMMTLCNAAFLRMLGYATADEVMGRPLHGEIHHSHADGSRYPVLDCPIYQSAQTGQAAWITDEVFFRKDGSQLPVDYRVEPVWRDGVLEGAICTFVNPSERLLGQQLKKVQKETEHQLRESHDQLRLAQVAGGIGVFLLEIETGTITASAEFCRLFGLPPSDTLRASDVPGLSEPDTLQTPSLEIDPASAQTPLTVEYRVAKADTGEYRWIARRAEFVRDDKGVAVWMRGVVQDVTDRKLAEATLRESESRFRVLAQAIPNQVWTASPDGKLDWLNQKVFDYSGLKGDQLLGDGWTTMVHTEDLPKVAVEWRKSLQAGELYETEFRIRRRDGVYRWHLVRALPILTGDEIRWLGTNTDIEDQKALQESLSELNTTLEERVAERTRDLDRMWRLSTDLILVADFDGLITAANPAWDKLLGWPPDALIGMSFMELVHAQDKAATLEQVASLAAGSITRRFENRYRHQDGSYKTISWIAVPDNELIHAVGRDISAEREASEALREAEERLRQSQKMEALGQLTGGIAHDFNNLLQGISGSIDVVRRRLATGRSDDVERFMDSATQSAHRAAALIHRLLAFARRQSLDSKQVDINSLVLSMEELLRRTLGEHIGLVVTPAESVWPAQSDENQLESAILNLAINARDAMPRGGTLTIATSNATLDETYANKHEGLQAGDYAMVSVSDTGMGMPPEILAKVFEPFFTTKPIGQGTGLGLSMIYGFAKQSGGHVRIHSHPGEGTIVRLYLPRHARQELVEVVDTGAIGAQRGEGETVLVVEDDAAVRLIVLDELGELGYTALEAVDGPSAIDILRSPRKIDLLLTDVGLPGMNGRQVAEIARQHRPQLRVLFMTGYAENATSRSEFLSPGMQMIAKPFAMDDLAGQIRDMLGEEPAP